MTKIALDERFFVIERNSRYNEDIIMFDVITIGTATRDIFLGSPLFKVLNDPKHLANIGFETGEAQCFALGSKVNVDTFVSAVGGDAANAAVTFARQGFKTAMVARVGADELGHAIVRELADEKITILNPHHTGETDYSTILMAPGGERTILVHRGTPLSRKDVPFAKLKAKWAYIAPANIQPAIMRDIIAALMKNKVRIAINPSRYYIENAAKDLKVFMEKADIVIMNREEVAELTGVPYGKEKQLFKKAMDVTRGIMIMTDGAHGALASDGKNVYRSGIFKQNEPVYRTGAGDAFGAGFVAGLIRSNDIGYALRLAAANSTSVIEHIGAQKGILTKKHFEDKRWKFLNFDVETSL